MADVALFEFIGANRSKKVQCDILTLLDVLLADNLAVVTYIRSLAYHRGTKHGR